jgi:hypothetical protein
VRATFPMNSLQPLIHLTNFHARESQFSDQL